jgi:anti-sigma-K factor RskA
MADDALHELTAAYALDALDPDDERAYEEHLARCERCREELTGFREAAGALAFATGPASPSPALRDRILDTARAERPNVVPLRPRWAYPVAAVAAAAACAAIGFGVWAASLHSQLGQRDAALRSVPLTGAAAGSVVVGPNGKAALVLADLKPPPAGKTYEAWVLKGGAAYPAGLFTAAGKTVVVPLEHKVTHGAVVGVTLERAGGAARPSLPVLVTSSPA